MPDREKVIRAWECCNPFDRKCNECPYEKDCYHDGISRHMVADAIVLLKEQDNCENCAIAIEDRQLVVRCKDCKHGSLYCTEDVCGETLIECNRPDISDVIEIHKWDWFCADGERKEVK